MPTYTLHGCTIEVAKGGRSARATRHVDADGKALQPPVSVEFYVVDHPEAGTPQVQAERWAKGKLRPYPVVVPESFEAAHAATAEPDEPTELEDAE